MHIQTCIITETLCPSKKLGHCRANDLGCDPIGVEGILDLRITDIYVQRGEDTSTQESYLMSEAEF